jgi:hypothetical protein
MSRPQDGVGYAFEPPTLASALYLVKYEYKNQTSTSRLKTTSRIGAILVEPYCYKGSRSPPLNNYDNPLLLGSLLAAIKGGVQGPQGDRGQHFTICPPHSILALASITHRDLGSTPSLDQLVPHTTRT